jgi:hypothetical protein
MVRITNPKRKRGLADHGSCSLQNDLLFRWRAASRERPGVVVGGDDQCGQATKGVWGMPWRQEAKKGVEDCDKPGGSVKRELIPGCPNQPVMNS